MKVLIVDDEKLARDRLVRLVEKMDAHEVAGVAQDGLAAIEHVEKVQPDVVLLDIRMPGMDGLEVARHLMKLSNPPAIIFCTAYGEYALEAFQTYAVGYLLKPVNAEQLANAINAATRPNRAQLLQMVTQSPAPKDVPENVKKVAMRKHISASTRHGLVLIPVADVRCFIADHKYVTVYHTKGELLIDDALKDLEEEFGEKFIRVHRNALVSLSHVVGMEKQQAGHYHLRIQGISYQPIISRRNVTQLRDQLKRL